MMKNFAFTFATLLSSVLAAPAVVWHSSEISNSNGRALHSSEDLSASDLMKNVLSEAPETPLSAVVFLVGKGGDGSEQLSELASSGKLPGTQSKYSDASGVYHSVSGLESTGAVVRETVSHLGDKQRVVEVSLGEFNRKLASFAAPVEVEIDSNGTPTAAVSSNKSVTKRARALAKADVYVVNVAAKLDASTIDSSITSAIENKNVGSVLLAGIRSIEEVKHERFLLNKRRMLKMEQDGAKIIEARGRRRLEQEGDGEANEEAQGDDLTGVYYVHMTPNIFSGILFFFMFIGVTITGITCMSDIQGGDVFVDKYPSLGREA
uniref:Uncharacterized protein n=1 Tax=Pseudo-nitzschia australis TaxID=44445 RepID=A0A7S4EQT5_9STRA|mmetsp:Transcript_19975/g.43441  ORF Transcript_19975/g.43441 Transcript_19975/m.43441 type:complete len:321 (+) Transcript_19975:199-1161(+)|eukprot:CAMPEP_0168179472 /NCGR_PEP_ID=MMETSP0139_2-20121125/9877_1 /TAXON_ID=44445 /ORGANISM="Pseudo-nitzschia australis, Strain 10249 10 AB" /LENGTH=320 /DNA_ID=CAMNT_0008099335 /DNA_START=81 /DNA_END=1043 /DNA_ORIENTATION=+